MLSLELIDSLFPADLPSAAHWAERYPPRSLPAGARGDPVRAVADRMAAHRRRLHRRHQPRHRPAQRRPVPAAHRGHRPGAVRGGGARAVRGGIRVLRHRRRRVGPGLRRRRRLRALHAVRPRARSTRPTSASCCGQGKAYPCFATKEELAAIADRQKAVGALPGYYGDWAIWRDAPEDQVRARLDAGDPYVVRFRSPGSAGTRVSYIDKIRGELSFDDNRNDVGHPEEQRPGTAAAHLPPGARGG